MIMTVADALRWVRKLKALDSEGAQVIFLRDLIEKVVAARPIGLDEYSQKVVESANKIGYETGRRSGADEEREACAVLAVAHTAHKLNNAPANMQGNGKYTIVDVVRVDSWDVHLFRTGGVYGEGL